MITNKISVTIRRPIEDVFSYMSDLRNGKQWQTGVIDVQPLSGGVSGAGSCYVVVRKFLGKKVESNVEITIFEPRHKIVLKSTSGAMPFEQTILFQPVDEGTMVNTVINIHPSGLMGMAESVIAGTIKREVEAAFGDLKDLMEQKMPEFLN